MHCQPISIAKIFPFRYIDENSINQQKIINLYADSMKKVLNETKCDGDTPLSDLDVEKALLICGYIVLTNLQYFPAFYFFDDEIMLNTIAIVLKGYNGTFVFDFFRFFDIIDSVAEKYKAIFPKAVSDLADISHSIIHGSNKTNTVGCILENVIVAIRKKK